jgi:hypothetical protein
MWIIVVTGRSFVLEQLKASLVEAGFAIEYDWLPDGDGIKVVFIVAKKI